MFEIIGSPKEHIVSTLESYIDIMKKNDGIIVLSDEKGEPKYHKEDEVWATFTETEVLVEGIEKFVYICISFTPASIEILEPQKLTFTDKNLSDWLNEMLSLLHEIGMRQKQKSMQNVHFIKSMDALMKNIIRISLEKGPLTLEDLSKKTGVDQKSTTHYLGLLEKKGKVKKDGGKWMRT